MKRASAPSASVREGDLVAGKYAVERVLGQGGMGTVVAARHLELETHVAVKFLLPELTRDAEAVARFQREARAAVSLKSEHSVRVMDVGKLDDGTPFMVMELLAGSDLATLLNRQGPLTVSDAVEFVLQACEAIAEAHALGIVHRDLKPQNLFLTRRVDGRPLVKVLDYGLAKPIGTSMLHPRGLTESAAAMGTPMYMSPEQMRDSKSVDGRTDVWSLGVCLYELLTGAMPFEGTTQPELCASVLKDSPRHPQALRPYLPDALCAVLLRCLEKDPGSRFGDVGALAIALQPFAPAHAAAPNIRAILDHGASRQAASSAKRRFDAEKQTRVGGLAPSPGWGHGWRFVAAAAGVACALLLVGAIALRRGGRPEAATAVPAPTAQELPVAAPPVSPPPPASQASPARSAPPRVVRPADKPSNVRHATTRATDAGPTGWALGETF